MTDIKIDAESKALSILFYKGGFSFCVTRQGNIIYQEALETKNVDADSFAEWVAEKIKTNMYLQQYYAQVVITFVNTSFSLVPNELAEKTDHKSWLEFSTLLQEDQSFHHANVAHLDLQVVYTFSPKLAETLAMHFPDAVYKHSCQVFLEHLTEVDDLSQAFVVIHPKQLEIWLFKNKQLQLYNVFEFATKEDLLYYVLYAFQKSELDTETTPLYYFGNTAAHQEAIKMLMKYVRHVIPGVDNLSLLQHYPLLKALS